MSLQRLVYPANIMSSVNDDAKKDFSTSTAEEGYGVATKTFCKQRPEREYYQYDRKGGTSEIDKFKRETGEK